MTQPAPKKWIHQLVPTNQTGRLTKWSEGGKASLKRKRRLQFIEAINRNYEDIDFSVHCISSTEGEISRFAQMFYLDNLEKITQELDDKNGNCLVFKISETKTVKVPVLRAAILIWIYYVVKYMKDEKQLTGFIYSDWLSGDRPEMKKDKALGVGLINFLLKATGIDLRLSIALDPKNEEPTLLSDWFSGWSNSSKNGSIDEYIKEAFDQVVERSGEKIDWIMYACDPDFVLKGSATVFADDLRRIGFSVEVE